MTIFSTLIAIITLPLVVNILVPLFALCCWLLIKPFSYLLPMQEVNLSRLEAEQDGSLEQRIENRFKIDELSATIADDKGFYKGVVANVSDAGVCLKNVPEHLSATTNRLSVIVRDKSEDYCFFMKPSWDMLHPAFGKMIGGKLSSPSKNWSQLVATR